MPGLAAIITLAVFMTIIDFHLPDGHKISVPYGALGGPMGGVLAHITRSWFPRWLTSIPICSSLTPSFLASLTDQLSHCFTEQSQSSVSEQSQSSLTVFVSIALHNSCFKNYDLNYSASHCTPNLNDHCLDAPEPLSSTLCMLNILCQLI